MAGPTNGELSIMIQNNTETLSRIEKHVVATNGSVKENTKFRYRQQVTNKWMYGLMTLFILPVIMMALPKLFTLLK